MLYWCNPECYKEEERVLDIYLNDSDVVVDVGANIGGLSLKAASRVGSTGRVYSIEAHPETYRYLVGNIRLNQFDNIRTFNIAVGEKEGVVNFTNKRADDMNEISPEGDIKVPVSTLDRILGSEVGVVHFLKVDVEGYEKFVMLGACELLKKTRCVYFESMECNFQRHGYSTPELIEILRYAGFRILRLAGEQLQEMPPNHVSNGLENLLAVKDLDDFLERTGLCFSC
jgi:FkbM family methyltransferase